MKDELFGKDLNELQEISLALGLPKFTGKQLADWLYKKEISSIDEMSNLSKKGTAQRKIRIWHFGAIQSAGKSRWNKKIPLPNLTQ